MRERVVLALEQRGGRTVLARGFALQALQREAPIGRQIAHRVHGAHAALAERVLHRVAAGDQTSGNEAGERVTTAHIGSSQNLYWSERTLVAAARAAIRVPLRRR